GPLCAVHRSKVCGPVRKRPPCPGARLSRTLLATMSVPISFPDPARGDDAVRSWRRRDAVPAMVVALAVAAAGAALEVGARVRRGAAGPRAPLGITPPGAAARVDTAATTRLAGAA